MEQLLAQKAKLSMQRDRILNELTQTEASLAEDEAALGATLNACSAAESEYDRIRGSAQRIRAEIAEKSAKRAEAETVLAGLKRREADLRKQLSKLFPFAFGKKRALRALLDETASAIASAEHTCWELENLQSGLEADPSFLEQHYAASKWKALTEKCRDLQNVITQHRDKLGKGKAELRKIDEELSTVNLSIEELHQKELLLVAQTAAEPSVPATALDDPALPNPPTHRTTFSDPVFEKLEALYPEHKVFALDSIDCTLREQLASMYQSRGYRTVEELLNANGFSLISGDQVKKIRNFVLYTPGNEPEIIRPKVESMLRRLEKYYPNKVISRGIQQDHKSLSQTISGLYQWLGYGDTGSMLEAYGFRYLVGSSGRPETDHDAVIDALLTKYQGLPKPRNMGILIHDNPEYKSQLKTLQNRAPELYGTSLKKHFQLLGLVQKSIDSSDKSPSFKTGSTTMQDTATR